MTQINDIEAIPHYSLDESEPVLFYGGPFSNFVGGPFKIGYEQPWMEIPYAREYGTVEHFFQASKATNRQDHDRIADAWDPGRAKVRGNAVDLRPDWEEVKYEVMLAGLRVKFRSRHFLHYLTGTKGRYIAEDSPTDFIWGIRSPGGGTDGLNLLGKALMEVRAEIMAHPPVLTRIHVDEES